MSTSVSFNGTAYLIPTVGESGWGDEVSDLLIALGTYAATSATQKTTIRESAAASVTVLSTDRTVVCTCATPVAVALPTPSSGQIVAVIGTQAAVTITPNGSDTINGAASFVADNVGGCTLLQFKSGSPGNWRVLSLIPQKLTASQVSDFTEAAQDAVGGTLTDTNSIDLTYDDGDNQIKADIKTQNTSTVTLAVDSSGLKADVVQNGIAHQSLSGAGTNTHAQIDTHLGSTSNPHSVTKSQVGLGNVTDNAQVKKSASSTDNQLVQWNGTTGDALEDSGKVAPSGAIVGTTDSQVLSNKDIDGGTASDTSRITIPKAATATLAALTRKEGTLLFDSTTKTVSYDNGTALVTLGAATSLAANVYNADGTTAIYASGAWNLKNASGTSTLQVSSAGAVTIGPPSKECLVSVDGGTGIPNGIVHLSSNCNPDGFTSSRTVTTRCGVAVMVAATADDSSQAVLFWGNQDGDATNAAADIIGSITAPGVWQLGPTAGGTTHIANGPTTIGNAVFKLLKKTGSDSGSNYYLGCYAGTTGTTEQGGLWNNSTGDFTVYTVSDARIKTNIRDAEYGLAEVLALRPRSFTKGGIPNCKGFIAQEVKTVLPESVGIKESEAYSDFHILETSTMIPVLVKAIQELSAKVDSMQSELAALKGT